jgi:hypothetical protein
MRREDFVFLFFFDTAALQSRERFMKLSSEQQTIFSDWVRQKMEHHACSLCQANKWKIGELMPEQNGTMLDDFDPARGHGMVQLICQNCGHVLLFDVRIILHWHEHDISQSAVM